MDYTSDYISEALKQLAEKRQKRNAEYNAKLKEVYKDIPQLDDIDLQLAKLGSTAALKALSGDAQSVKKAAEDSKLLQEQKTEILKNAGVKKNSADCEKCNDTGYVNGKLCDCVKQLAITLNREKLEADMPIGSCTFADFNLDFYPETPDANGVVPRKVMSGVLNMAKNYCNTFSRESDNILFMGGVGLGKTHLSIALVNEIIKKGYSVIYRSAQNMFNDAEHEYFSRTGTTAVMDALLGCDLLVIDDLGTEFSSSFTQSVFYNIVNTRLLKKLPTVINTNLSFKEIEEKYTPRISSRFIGNYKMIKFFGTDIRMQKMLGNM